MSVQNVIDAWNARQQGVVTCNAMARLECHKIPDPYTPTEPAMDGFIRRPFIETLAGTALMLLRFGSYSLKGAFINKSTVDTVLYPWTKRSPKSRRKLS